MSFSKESIVEFRPDVAYACTLLSDFTLGSESNEVKARLPAGRAKKTLTGPVEGIRTYFMTAAVVQKRLP